MMKQESLFIQHGADSLHLRRIWQPSAKTPILMVHGAIENGRIFYTESGKGLACYLASQGFDVYVADLRGRGASTPAINKETRHGQFEAITQDIPLFLDFISQKTQQPMHVISHSWGGVLVASTLARFPERLSQVRSKICFGTKRKITIKSVEKFFKVDLFWNRFAAVLAKRTGYFNAKKYGVGSDNETIASLQHSVAWVNNGAWVDPEDGFDYANAALQIAWPATWHLTGVKDSVLGNAVDVQVFIAESSREKARFSLLSKQSGNALDYDHINILTHPLAIKDHFPQLVEWLIQHN